MTSSYWTDARDQTLREVVDENPNVTRAGQRFEFQARDKSQLSFSVFSKRVSELGLATRAKGGRQPARSKRAQPSTGARAGGTTQSRAGTEKKSSAKSKANSKSRTKAKAKSKGKVVPPSTRQLRSAASAHVRVPASATADDQDDNASVHTADDDNAQQAAPAPAAQHAPAAPAAPVRPANAAAVMLRALKAELRRLYAQQALTKQQEHSDRANEVALVETRVAEVEAALEGEGEDGAQA